MPEQIQLTVTVQVTGGPKKTVAQTISVEAYDKIGITVDAATPGGPSTKTVEVQPGGAGQVQFLLITASSYTTPLTYTIDGGTSITLDAPLLLAGAGAVSALAATQQTFVFSNSDSAANAVEILVGRDATP